MTVAVRSRYLQIRKSLLFSTHISSNRNVSTHKWKVLFFGTDDFSLCSLKALSNEHACGNIDKLEIVSNVTGKANAVVKYANQEKIKLHVWPLRPQPEGLFHLGIVVSFGHLIPERIIKSFPMGILNVHASLLPRWRGAAPIIHTLLNGDTKTGVTVMRIHPKHFDVGDIVAQREIEINDDILQPELHNILAGVGAEVLVQCLHQLPDCLSNAKPQENTNVTYAPKVKQSHAHINWHESSAIQIYNLSRALYGIYPLLTKFNDHPIKLFKTQLWRKVSNVEDTSETVHKSPGFFKYMKERQVIRVWCKGGDSICFDTVGIPGRKNMTALDFRNGFMKHVPENKLVFTSIT